MIKGYRVLTSSSQLKLYEAMACQVSDPLAWQTAWMSSLILKRASASRLSGEWKDDDFQGPDASWLWCRM
jgi:hypothetical protein